MIRRTVCKYKITLPFSGAGPSGRVLDLSVHDFCSVFPPVKRWEREKQKKCLWFSSAAWGAKFQVCFPGQLPSLYRLTQGDPL